MNRDDATKEAGDALEKLGTRVLDAAFKVNRGLCPGPLESAYEMAFCHELAAMQLRFERQKDLPVDYKGTLLDCGYRVDLLIGGKIIIELKCVESLQPIHEARLLTYLKPADKRLGFLNILNVRLFKQGIKRIVNDFPDASRKTISHFRSSRP